MESLLAAAAALWFMVSAGYAASVGVAAIRTRSYAPDLGLELRGRGAVVAGWATLVLSAALLAAGALVSFVASRA